MRQKEANAHITLAPLNGLVLAGGYSTRMGQDKGAIIWYDKEQRYRLSDLLRTWCSRVFISCRSAQEKEISKDYQVLPDVFFDLGPYGALLSAFKKLPDQAWLVVACDMPLLDVNAFDFLTKNRDHNAIATALENPSDGLPEPMISIWEPSSHGILLKELDNGCTSLRKILQSHGGRVLKSPDPEMLTNINTPFEADQIREKISRTCHDKPSNSTDSLNGICYSKKIDK